MKNWGKFFILVMTLFTLISCSEKGSGGGGVTSINVSKDDGLARLIANNINELNSFQDNFSNDLSYAKFELERIKDAYENGNKTISEVGMYQSSSRDSIDRYISSRNWLNFNNISLTHINLSLINTTLIVDPLAKKDVEESKKMFESEENIIINARNMNRYYLELRRSSSVNTFLSSTTLHDSNKTYQVFLKELDVLADQQLTNQYLKIIEKINLDLEILRKINVVYDIGELSLSMPLSTRYKIGGYVVGGIEKNSVISVNNRDKLISNLERLKTLYLEGNTMEITQELANFNILDEQIISNSLIDFMTYYDVYPHDSIPGKLTVASVVSEEYGISAGENLLDELKRIYLDTESNLDEFEKNRLFILIQNIEYYIKQIEEYSYFNPTINKYSKTVNSLQLIQLLWDEKDIITPILKRNKK